MSGLRVKACATLVVAATVLLAACSSSNNSSSGNTSTGSTTPASTSTSSSGGTAAGVSEARAFLQQYLKAPTSVGITEPLSKKPDPATVVAVEQVQPAATQENDYLQQATDALGLHLIRIRLGSSPQAASDAFDTALKDNPKAITDLAQPVRTFQAQLAEAKSRGIPVMETSDTDTPGGGLVSTGVNNAAMTAIEGKMAAAWFIVDSNGTGETAVYNIPEIPILGDFTTSFVATVKQWCPGCTTTVVNMQAADIGTNIPNQVVSFQQSHPSYKYAMFALGDMTLGLKSALSAAGITGLKIGGQAPSAADLQALKDGSETMWCAVSLPVIAWRNADTLARLLNKDPLDGTDSAPLPTEVLTKDNIGSAALDSNGNYVGIANYQAAFSALWHLSGS
jgi:ribose transport system substrate-binding protein